MYGGQVTYALEGNSICLETFENISTVTVHQNDVSSISSDSSRVCLCNEGRVDCSILSLQKLTLSTSVKTFIIISAVTVGQNFGTVTRLVYAQYLKKSPTDNLLELDISTKF